MKLTIATLLASILAGGAFAAPAPALTLRAAEPAPAMPTLAPRAAEDAVKGNHKNAEKLWGPCGWAGHNVE